ncbi:MAG: hypothetical protein IT380_00070 [Myxococcales bacterium]|nr:hypothetical protein [Myxococcales bacterium]
MIRQAMFLLAAVLLSCTTAPEVKKESASLGPSARDFYPLTVGTKWSYEVNLLGEKRSIDVAIQKLTPDGYALDSTGAQLLVDSYGVRDQKRYLLRNPIEAGTKWTNVVSVSSVEHYEILAADQPCDAPAGAWKGCVVVESRNKVEEGKILVNEMTFAPGVGIVRLSTVLEAKGQKIPQSTLALSRFEAPKAP